MFDFHFDWKPDLNTNIETIDTHHRQLFKIGRDMEQLIQKKCIGVTDKQLLDIVCDLREYTVYHFYEEERLMEEYQYPEIEAHKKMHILFANKITKINMPRLKENPEVELEKVKDLVQENFYNHILTEDKKMAAYVLEKMKATAVVKPEKIQEKDIYEIQYGAKICDLDMVRVYLYPDQSHKGHLVLAYKEREIELERLTALERNMFFSDVAQAAKVIKKLYKPEAFNYASFGDMDSQLCMHIVPKYQDQLEWGEIFSMKKEKQTLLSKEYEEMVIEIKKQFQ